MTVSRNPTTYGGQALIEGVMIRGQHAYSIAARRPDGSITCASRLLPAWGSMRLRRIPFVRGTLVLAESMTIGMKALMFSAQVAAGEGEDDQPIPPWALALTLLASLGLAVGLFFVSPLAIVHSLVDPWTESSVISNIAEGTVRLGIFLAYLLLIGWMPSVRRVLGYHAAEHMTIHAHEHRLPLDLATVRQFPSAHPRCGTAFLLTVMVVSVLVFTLLGKPDLPDRILSRILLIPLIAGISYEYLRFTATHANSTILRWAMAPNLWLQALTTRPPDDGQIEVAIAAMGEARRAEHAAGAV